MITTIHKIPASGWYELTFDLGSFPHAGRRMIVTGEFSDWATSICRKRTGFIAARDDTNTVKLTLPPGEYQYKYYDIAHGEWMEIERYPEIYRGFHWDYIRNPFGTLNCIIRLA